MTYSVYQHWDPLRVCVVGQSYPPEFYSWIKVAHVRKLFEKIAQETEEDFVLIIKTLESFGVKVMRPNIEVPVKLCGNKFPQPPMTPRDTMIMISNKFYRDLTHWEQFYHSVKDPSWQWHSSYDSFLIDAHQWQINEVKKIHGADQFIDFFRLDNRYKNILDHIIMQGNTVVPTANKQINGAYISRIGHDLYFSTETYDQDQEILSASIHQEFPHTRNHIINTGGHGDGTYCPVCPGLIISLEDVATYADTFPGWEVVYLPGQSWDKVKPFLELKGKNQGRWWIPGFEHDQAVVDTVETWLKHWTGFVEETVFDVNMLVIDPKNVMVFNENDKVFEALARYGITPHVVPFRHRYFWDGGIHCVTLDLDRHGEMKNFFPSRNTKS